MESGVMVLTNIIGGRFSKTLDSPLFRFSKYCRTEIKTRGKIIIKTQFAPCSGGQGTFHMLLDSSLFSSSNIVKPKQNTNKR